MLGLFIPLLSLSLPAFLNGAKVFVTDCFISFQVLVNTACCFLMLVAKLIQCMVFGPLRVSERQVRQQCVALDIVMFHNLLVYDWCVLYGIAESTQEK